MMTWFFSCSRINMYQVPYQILFQDAHFITFDGIELLFFQNMSYDLLGIILSSSYT
jgi:hypothetical protein